MKVEVRTKERKKERNEDIIYLRGTKRYKRHLNKTRKLVGPTVDKSKRIYIRRIKLFNKIKYATLSWKQRQHRFSKINAANSTFRSRDSDNIVITRLRGIHVSCNVITITL